MTMKIRVLHVVRRLRTVRAFLLPILSAEREAGHRFEIACGAGDREEAEIGAPVHHYPVRRSLSPAMIFSASSVLSGIIREGRYDVVAAHMALPGLISRISFARAGRPGRLLYVSHGLPCYPARPLLSRLFALSLEKLLSRWTDGMVVLNRYDYRAALAHRLAGAGGTVHLLKSVGIDYRKIVRRTGKVDPSAFREKWGFRADLPLVCYAGRLIAPKGAEIFVRLARRYLESGRQASFAVAGEGPLRGSLESFLRRHRLESFVRLLGYRGDVIELLAASDVFCFPTLYEGSPVAVQEAMAAGTPVLASRVPGCEDLIDDGINGLLVSPRDIGGFRSGLDLLLGDSTLRSNLAAAARKRAEEFDLSRCVGPWVEVIEKTAAAGGPVL